MAKEFSFEDLNKEMAKNSFLGERLDKSTFSKIDSYIHSGNYHLNACITGSLFRGYPGNRAVALAGSPGTGKTYLLLNAIRYAQQDGYYVVFYDSENAVDVELAKKFGIDPEKFRYEPVGTIQEFRTSITQLTQTLIEQQRKGVKIPKLFIALDSVGSLPTEKEIDDAISASGKADMTRAKMIRSIFRILINRLGEIKAPFIFTNHTYQTTDLFSREIAGGGKGPEYAASIILFLAKKQLKEGTEKTGIIVKVKPNKNRFAIPNEIEFHVDFRKGMNQYVGMEKYIDWETCGIAPGRLMEAVEYGKYVDRFTKKNDEKKLNLFKELVGSTEYTHDGQTMYFVSADIAKSVDVGGASRVIAVKHLNAAISPKELFTDKVFTKDVLKVIDERHIMGRFEYSDVLDETEEIATFLEVDNENETDESED